jgi:long-chain acyl-CoA synthetase
LLTICPQNSLKLKRPQTARAFKKEIERMYEEIAANAAEKPKL